MSLARLVKNVYLVAGKEFGDRGNAYLVKTSKANFLIDTGGEPQPVSIMRNLLTLTDNKNELIYLFLTSCISDASAGASFLSASMNVKIIIHEDDASQLRKGYCMGLEYPPSSPYMVIRKGKMIFEGFEIFKASSPTKGSIVIKFDDFLFSGATELTPLDSNVKYVFGLYRIKRC
ncbi:MAG: MBL fold metallo-hydrolase [Metallosphaera sp.]|uniref:Beta-lactamase domain-containing protein n=1 Tax=Metallosphaera cuprina (strain Ar-4) TaxID=1006006 RepID=F4G3D5_METCR|nr:MBL fold metallo-hydrolase [Metallosphaera cuprina]AEB94133.1 conserved hypothetical protein [Metallosphaera cuprina Ar-4]